MQPYLVAKYPVIASKIIALQRTVLVELPLKRMEA